MKNKIRTFAILTGLGACLLGATAAQADPGLVLPTVTDPAYRIRALMPKTPGNGFNGLAFDSQGTLHAGVVQGSTTYRIDKETGATSVFIPPRRAVPTISSSSRAAG